MHAGNHRARVVLPVPRPIRPARPSHVIDERRTADQPCSEQNRDGHGALTMVEIYAAAGGWSQRIRRHSRFVRMFNLMSTRACTVSPALSVTERR